MVIEYVQFRIPVSRRAGFMLAYQRVCKLLAGSPYCLGYELSQCQNESMWFVLRVEWTSTRDHWRFKCSVGFRELLRTIRPYLDLIEEVNHYAPTSLRSGPRRFDLPQSLN